jgi:selenocysteine lyase/cysteine desulfurase
MERGIESVVRASMHYYNSEEELEHFLSKIRQLVA